MIPETIVEVREPTVQQGTAYCPCCGSRVDSRDVYLDRESGVVSLGGVSASLNGQQTTIVIHLLRAWPRTVSTDALLMALYADREEPETATKVLHNVLKMLRPIIAPLGLSVSHRFGVGYKLSIPQHASVNKLSVNRRAA